MKKFYIIDSEAMMAGLATLEKPLPLQQQLILKAMCEMDRPATGSEIIAYAIEHKGLVTKQRHDVLYAWYARSNEKFGVKLKG